MPSILEMLTQQLGSGTATDLSRRLGADEHQTSAAMSAALPVLLGALARNSAKPEGAAALHRALEKDHDGSVLDNLAGFLDKPDENTGNGILGHVLGNKRSAVEAGVSKASGLDAQGVTKMMTMLAPLVMGALGRTQRQQRLDPGALAGALGAERQQIEKQSPALGGLAGLLDADGDGQIVDDLVGKLGKGLLGSLFGRRR
jgi:hypothetical protein